MAAVLAGGPAAALSHRAAGAGWGLRQWNGVPSITVPKWRPSRPTIELHTCPLPRDERTSLDGIPITTVARTLLDLATVLESYALARAVAEAVTGEMAGPLSLPDLLERHRGRRGAGSLRAALTAEGFGLGVTRSELEERFLPFLATHSLPHPELNASLQVDGRFYSPDCLWRPQRVIVELDGAAFHESPLAQTRDSDRDRRLVLARWNVIHVTWSQVHDPIEAAHLACDLRLALGASG